MNYPINELIKIDSYDHNGNPKIIIFIRSEKQGIEADYIEFDHANSTFTAYTYRQ